MSTVTTKRDPYEGSHFLKADDIMGRMEACTAVIDSILPPGAESDARGKVIDRKIVTFQKTGKQLILSPLNHKVLKINLGPNEEDWPGKKLTLVVRYLDAFGELDLPCIRIWPEKPIPKSMREKFGEEKPKHQ